MTPSFWRDRGALERGGNEEVRITGGFTEEERRRIAALVGGGERAPPCPRCGRPLQLREIPPRADLPYVRSRLWLLCDRCEATAVFDRRALERVDEAASPGGETPNDESQEDAPGQPKGRAREEDEGR